MRLASLVALALCEMLFVAASLVADDYLKDSELTQPLKIVQLQGGFAGFTGMQYTIGRDGAWASESVFKEKLTPKGAGFGSKPSGNGGTGAFCTMPNGTMTVG